MRPDANQSLTQFPAGVAIDGSKFKAVNTRDKNFARAKMERSD
jgi:transposase